MLLFSLSYKVILRVALSEVWAQTSGSFSLGASCLKGSPGKFQLHTLQRTWSPQISMRLNLSIASLLLDEESRVPAVVNRLRDTPRVIPKRILLTCMPISELKYCC